MTVGERIAQKRKELGLSQEGLGERLGVSRQAIYKWESNASLPEIDKLVALSRIFSVTVGWLLGVEEPAAPEGEGAGDGPGELTREQLAMVEEIVSRYLAARAGEVLPKKRRTVFKLAVGIGVVCLAAGLFSLASRLDRVSQDYDSLRYSIDQVSQRVDSQIGSITGRVEDILKSQNDLTAEWSTQVASTDLGAGTVTFDVRVVPKTYVEGMTALFLAESGGETAEQPVEAGADHAFTGQITCPLTDEIQLSVVLLHGDQRQTQWLEDYDRLYSGSFPNLTLSGRLWVFREADNVLRAEDEEVTVDRLGDEGMELDLQLPADMDLQVGLFRDRELVAWFQRQEEEYLLNGKPAKRTVWRPEGDITLEPGHVYCEAAVYTDEYGRQAIYTETPVEYDELHGSWESVSRWNSFSTPEGWTF